jgi:nitrate reductase delta subunit
MFAAKPKSMSLTLRVLARLLSYPDAALRAHLDEMRDALRAEQALSAPRLAEIEALIASIARQSAIDAEADYVQLFDSGRSTSLHLFEHVHGDSRDRGPAMIDLVRPTNRRACSWARARCPTICRSSSNTRRPSRRARRAPSSPRSPTS